LQRDDLCGTSGWCQYSIGDWDIEVPDVNGVITIGDLPDSSLLWQHIEDIILPLILQNLSIASLDVVNKGHEWLQELINEVDINPELSFGDYNPPVYKYEHNISTEEDKYFKDSITYKAILINDMNSLLQSNNITINDKDKDKDDNYINITTILSSGLLSSFELSWIPIPFQGVIVTISIYIYIYLSISIYIYLYLYIYIYVYLYLSNSISIYISHTNITISIYLFLQV
jgi:hypothetical protein